jgi:MYXO-CTERM domain-containing protein
MISLLLLAAPSMAFQPPSDQLIGQEPVRMWRFHLERQGALRQGDAWQDFLAGEGAGWQARFDERAGTIHRAWGPGIDLQLAADAQGPDVSAAILALLERNPGLAGVDIGSLKLRAAGYAPATGTWYVGFDRMVDVSGAIGLDPSTGTGGDVGSGWGVGPLANGGTVGGSLSGTSLDQAPVWRGGIEVRVRNGKVVMLGLDTYPGADAAAAQTPALSADTAVEVAIAEGPAAAASHEIVSASLVVLPLEAGRGLDHRLCWQVRTRTADPVGVWVSFVDAQTGDLLNVHNEVRFATGTLFATHDTRTVNGEMSTTEVHDAWIQSDAAGDYTGDDGSFNLADDAPFESTLSGTYLRVRNDEGDEGTLTVTGDEATWTTEAATQAEIDSYIFLTQVREWGEVWAPDVSMVTDRLTSNVNLASTCNAYFDGSVNFYQAGGGCNNTGRIADVAYHEWGHGLHYYSLETGTYDGSLGEAVGDIVSFLLTGDAVIAPYFMTNGSGIRDVAPDYVYPDDWVGEVHYDGLIFGGAMWDLWDRLEEDYSEEDAYNVLVPLFVNMLKAGPDIPGAYDELLVVDDDNDDLGDGTPNQCALIDAFAPHGLGPGGGDESLLGMEHEMVDNQAASASSYTLTAEVTNLAPECISFEVASATVHYSTDDGESWEEAALSADGSDVSGSIPAQADGSVVTYYVNARSSDGDEVTVPSGADINPTTFYVGELVELYCEDFESDDGDYTSELVSGADELGADDWVWGTPRGTGGDPDFAFSGDRVWGNDLGGGNYNGEYQDDKHNRLSSPAIDVTGFEEVVVQYRRWLNVEDGYYDAARVLANGNVIWSNHESSSNVGDEHHADVQWALETLVVAPASKSLELAWEIESDGGLTMGGWNIDDVCVYGRTVAPVDTDEVDTGPETSEPTDDVTPEDEWKALACGCASTNANGMGGGAMMLLALGALITRRRRQA